MADPIELLILLQDKVTEPARKAGGSLDELAEKAGPVGEVLGGPVVAGAVALAATVVALGAAIADVTIEFAKLAIEATEAKEKALATLSALAGGSEKAEALYASLGAARSQLGMTRKELIPLTEQLLGMGVAAESIPSKLKALATVKAIGIEGGVEEYLTITKNLEAHVPVAAKQLANLYKTGVNVNEIAAAMGVSVKTLEAGLKKGTVSASAFQKALDKAVTDKGAGALSNQAKSLTSQWDNFKESLTDLFDGVDASPFLSALHDVLGLVDQATPSGQELKSAITGALNAVFKTAAKVLPYIKVGIEKFIILILKAYIMVKTHWTQIAPILKYVAIGIGVLVGGVVLLVGIVLGLVAAFGLLVTALFAAAGAIVSFGAKAGAAIAEWVKSAYDSAKNFILGLVDGIKNGAGIVIDAIKGLGKSMLNGLKGILGISSPSKEFAKLGQHAGAGFAMGLEASTAGVEVSAGAIGAAAVSAAAPGKPAGGGGAGKGDIVISFAPGSIVIDGAGKSAEQLTETMIATVFERIALAQGLGT